MRLLKQTAKEAFELLVDAAIKGERCPQTHPHGPLRSAVIGELYERGMIRSEVYAHNFRRVVILIGEHAGKATAPHPKGFAPYRINGRQIS